MKRNWIGKTPSAENLSADFKQAGSHDELYHGKGMVAQVAGKHYPAPMTSVVTIEEAAHLPRDAALDFERKHFNKLAKSTEAQELVGIFLKD